MGQDFAFSILKSTPTWKKYTTAGCEVGTNISYASHHASSLCKSKNLTTHILSLTPYTYQRQWQSLVGLSIVHFRYKILMLLEQCISCFTISSCVQPFECSIFYYYKSTSLLFETEDFFVNLHQLLNNLLLSLQHIPSKRLNYANRFVHIVKTSRLADDHDPQVWWLLYYPIKKWPQLSKQVCKKKPSRLPLWPLPCGSTAFP